MDAMHRLRNHFPVRMSQLMTQPSAEAAGVPEHSPKASRGGALFTRSHPCRLLLSIGKTRYGFKIIRLRLNAHFQRVRSVIPGITYRGSAGTRRPLLTLLSISFACPTICPMACMWIFSRLWIQELSLCYVCCSIDHSFQTPAKNRFY